MAEIRINATGGLKLYDADDSHYAQILAGTITSNTDVMTLGHAAVVMGTALDINGNELILDADADTSLTADTDDQIDFKVSGTDQIKLVDGALSPVTDNDIDLGTTSLEFKNVYVDGTVRTDAIDFGTTTMTLPTGDGSANQFIKTDGSGTLSFAAAGGDLSFGGDTFGADKVIGSNDDYDLTFETNNTARLNLAMVEKYIQEQKRMAELKQVQVEFA